MLNLFDTDNRVVGDLGLSIATDLAIAGGFGEHPDRPNFDERPLTEYVNLWINVSTLARNVYNSIPSDDRLTTTSHDVTNHVLSDMEIIKTILEQKSEVIPKFYLCHYKDITKRWDKTLFREVKTQNQINLFKLMEETNKELSKEKTIEQFDLKLKGTIHKEAILTHMPIDLLWYRDFTELALLESHTGILKKRDLWYTKFTDKGSSSNIPFNPATLKIFGDGNNYIQQMPKKLRQTIVDIGVKRKWTWMTTEDRFKENIKLERDPVLYDLIKNLLKV